MIGRTSQHFSARINYREYQYIQRRPGFSARRRGCSLPANLATGSVYGYRGRRSRYPDAAIWPLAETAEVHEAPLPLRVVQGLGNAALIGLVAFELSPLNEISRIAAAGAVGTLTGSPELAAATFAVSSLAIEGVGALATAH